jgi:hypothetical protein
MDDRPIITSSLHEFAVGWMEKNLVTTSQEKR